MFALFPPVCQMLSAAKPSLQPELILNDIYVVYARAMVQEVKVYLWLFYFEFR